MKHLLIAVIIMTIATAHAAQTDDLTESDKARTASFVFKAELFLGCKQPFDMTEGSIPQRLAFVQKWLSEDINGIGESKAGKIQKVKMTAFLKDISSLSDPENKPKKWKNKDVVEIAEAINTDLRSIAQAADVTL